ncbi:unnamed protein product [Ilex paraguariensis]|uniref:Alpha/beta hydrolase fold-3 domain-containing protein n=1 Tax=Ilex paraguariensis TaxID=185542 RepID=A0ABC8SVS4_9AQUA
MATPLKSSLLSNLSNQNMSAHQSPPPSPTTSVSSKHQPNIVGNLDGTYTRFLQFPCTAASQGDDGYSPVLTKDMPLNPEKQTWVRIFLPRQALHSCAPSKLPLIVYFHGGGFVFLSAASTDIHNFCLDMATQLFAVIVSVEYRLAPEHRLPAAYDDAVEALNYIKSTQEKWLSACADFDNCFLMGTSAGGNIAYHAGLRVAEDFDGFNPLKIKGLILHHPFFGGSERTQSELSLANGPVLTLSGTDLMWKLSLPIGSDRDHEYSNPMVGGGSEQLELIRSMGFRILVAGCYGDLLIDRQVEFTKMLEKKGIKTVAYLEEGYHAIELSETSKSKELFAVIKAFIK